jgi:hypothetical protein
MSTFGGGLSNAQAAFNQTPSSGVFAGNNVQFPTVRLQSAFKAGVAADQIDGYSQVNLALAASTPQNVDLMALVDFQGVALTVLHIAFIAIKVLTPGDGFVILVGAAGANEFNGFVSAAGTVTVYPPSPTGLNDGFTVFSAPSTTGMPVSSSHHLLKFDPGTTAQNVIVLIGTRST